MHGCSFTHRPCHDYRQEFAKVHGLTFVGASFFFGDWDATPPAQRKREYSNI